MYTHSYNSLMAFCEPHTDVFITSVGICPHMPQNSLKRLLGGLFVSWKCSGW